MWLSRRRRAEGLLAESLYETLGPAEQAELDRALARWPGLAREAAGLRRMVAALPADDIAFSGDLMPAIRARLHEAPPAAAWGWRRHGALAALAFLTASLAWQFGGGLPSVQAPGGQLAREAPLAGAMAQARAALERREPGTAVTLVREALAAQPGAPDAGEAIALVGDIEFAHLRRYAEADAAYGALRAQYPAVFAGDPAAIARYDVLSESRGEAYAPLLALDAARDSFEGLERVLTQYPNQLVASLALDAMRDIECAPGGADSADEVAALESVRARCTHPLAIAQVGLNLGDAYWKRMNNPERARAEFMTVAGGPHPGLAAAAREALARLDAVR